MDEMFKIDQWTGFVSRDGLHMEVTSLSNTETRTGNWKSVVIFKYIQDVEIVSILVMK